MSSNVAPGTTTPGERKRRHHHRSRNGCISCKQRHMRCDESKPFWLVNPKSFQPDPMIIVSSRNCLKNGSSCGYTRVEAPTSNIAQPLYTATSPVHEVSANSILSAYLNQPSNAVPGSSAEPGSFFNPGSSGLPLTFGPQSPLTSGFDIEMMDPFNALPASMSHKSNMLLNHFNNYRVLLREPVRRPPGGEMFAWAATDAALLHASLVLAGKHWTFLGGSKRLIESTLYYHKMEAIRLLNERLADPVNSVSDGTVGAVGVLIFVECLDGSREAASVHLDGLEKMVQMRGDLYSPSMSGLLQRMIFLADLLTATANNCKPRFQKTRPSGNDEIPTPSMTKTLIQPEFVNDSFYKEIGLDGPLSKMFMDLHWLSFLMVNNDRNAGATDNDVLTSSITESERYIDTMLRGGQYGNHKATKGVVAGRAFVVLAGYIYLYLYLRRIEVNNRLYDWMVDLLREDLGNVERRMRESYPPELLFWVLFVGACASVGRRELDWFKKELRVSKEILGLNDWIGARYILMKFAWAEGWNESINEIFWHELG
ncbi:hypothetical protein EG329_002784 [Mollisiaceae sp. DMI_Dod_QoI]|nr:hypothetical protein EG329_002784 [Helotiales sp. DMI_Dod_QoI]